MATNDEQGEDKSGKGFAGLSSMVSDVDATVTEAKHAKPDHPTSTSTTARASTTPQPEASGEPDSEPQPYQHNVQSSSGGSSAGKWLLGIGLAIGFIWLLSQSGNNSPPPAPVYSPSSPPTVNRAPAPTYQPQRVPAQPQVPHRPVEEQPQVGTNNVLGPAQIRYCLAEDIRLEAAKGALNSYVESDVDRFNAMVADYNGRCGQFRYRRGSLETARSEIEAFRSILQSEGQSRFLTKAKPRYQEAPASTNPGRQRIPKSVPTPPQPRSDAAQSNQSERNPSLNTGIRCSYSTECAGSNQCLDGQCRPSRTAGERCSYSTECAGSNQCLDGQCRPSRTAGERCSYSTECAGSNECLNGQCRPPLSTGRR